MPTRTVAGTGAAAGAAAGAAVAAGAAAADMGTLAAGFPGTAGGAAGTHAASSTTRSVGPTSVRAAWHRRITVPPGAGCPRGGMIGVQHSLRAARPRSGGAHAYHPTRYGRCQQSFIR